MPELRLPARLERRIAERRKRLDEQRPLAPTVVRATRLLLERPSTASTGMPMMSSIAGLT